MRILYAEDERDLNEIVTRALKSEGYGVDRCFDGRTAWEYLQAAEYDAVIFGHSDAGAGRADGAEEAPGRGQDHAGIAAYGQGRGG